MKSVVNQLTSAALYSLCDFTDASPDDPDTPVKAECFEMSVIFKSTKNNFKLFF